MLETEEMIKRYLEGEDIVPAKSDGDQAMLAFREFKRRKDETLRRKYSLSGFLREVLEMGDDQ